MCGSGAVGVVNVASAAVKCVLLLFLLPFFFLLVFCHFVVRAHFHRRFDLAPIFFRSFAGRLARAALHRVLYA